MSLDASSPEAWLRYARSDLALARQPLSADVLREALAFHAQQAAERSIKAVLVHFAVPFPKTHSIERLVDLLPANVPRPSDLLASARLTAYATVYRYPAEEEPISPDQLDEALRLAQAVYAWAHRLASSSARRA
jgi:HEPN domain-containing protein